MTQSQNVAYERLSIGFDYAIRRLGMSGLDRVMMRKKVKRPLRDESDKIIVENEIA